MRKIPLISPAVSTPLAIGFRVKTYRVILPDREYTDDELRLIFRHELIHLVREDSWTKFYLLTIRALCWFLPHIGKTVEYAARDMELSCDEAVLRDQNEDVRQLYGRLILSTASSAAGFTTCLSATAESMKYRPQRILSNEKRSMGLPFIAIAFLLLAVSFKLVTVAVEDQTMAEKLAAENINLADYELVSVIDNNGQEITGNHSEEAWTQMILDTRLYRLAGDYSYESDGDTYTAEYGLESGYGILAFTRTKHTMSFHFPGADRTSQFKYWVR